MAEKIYSLKFDGYWVEANASGLPSLSGIYCVYACMHDAQRATVTLRRVLYIGEALNVHARVGSHEKRPLWEANLVRGEKLCFSAALIWPDADRQRAEAAMIYQHKPPCNKEYVHAFPFAQTTIVASGSNVLLTGSFTVCSPVTEGLAALLARTAR